MRSVADFYKDAKAGRIAPIAEDKKATTLLWTGCVLASVDWDRPTLIASLEKAHNRSYRLKLSDQLYRLLDATEETRVLSVTGFTRAEAMRLANRLAVRAGFTVLTASESKAQAALETYRRSRKTA